MDGSVRLGRIAGIAVGINWSWLVVFALIVWTLAESVFPNHNAGLGDGTYVAMAVVAALLFFVSLLAHELGHALQARREGMETEGITLWLLGGIAKFKGSFPSAGAELRTAVAGPLVTLVLGVAFVLVAWSSGLPHAVDGVAAWLGYMNLLLLAFNLLPALPLDGGRVLHAALWRAKRDLAWSTRIAAGIGGGFAALLIGVGVLELILLRSFGGVWLAFIGWFLLAAAGAERRHLAARQALAGLRVRDLMVREPATVDPELTLDEFMGDVVWRNRYTSYPVVEDGRTVGLLPFRAVAEVPRAYWDDRRVRERMLPRGDAPVFDEDDALADALEELSETEINRGLVLDGDRLVGLLSITDLARALEVGRLSPSTQRR